MDDHSDLNYDQVDERFIGEGERTSLKILKSIFGDNECDYKIQYPFHKLMKGDFLTLYQKDS